MPAYHVDSEQVAASASLVAASAENLRGEVAQMMANLLALQDSWGGIAQASFAECAATWRQTQAQVEAALDDIATRLGSAAATYSEAEAASAALFAGGI